MNQQYILRSLKIYPDRPSYGRTYFKRIKFRNIQRALAAYEKRKQLLDICCDHYRIVLITNNQIMKEFQK